MPIDLYRYFKGKWEIKKIIESYKKKYAEASGYAEFIAIDDDTLLMKEHGILQIEESENNTVPFSKSYRYEFTPDKMYVYFNDGVDAGNLYQSYTINDAITLLSESEKYLCVDDNYWSKYQIIKEHHFVLETFINGPKKDANIKTSFTKL